MGTKTETKSKCPFCGASENQQIKRGLTVAGSQRYSCHKCGKRYTPQTKEHYSQETKELAIKTYYSGVSARGVAKIFNMSQCNVLLWIKKNNRISK